MKMLTRTMLGALLLAGSASLVLAAGANPDASLPNATTPGGMSSTSTAPTMVPGGAMWSDQSADNPARPPSIAQGDQTQGGDQTGARTWQDQPTRTDQMRSPDLAQANPSARPSAVPQDSAPSATTGGRTAGRQVASTQPTQQRSRHNARTDEAGDRMTEALNLLSADGYTNVQSLTPQGEQFVANAMLNGRNVSVVVDPQTHKITNRS